MKFFYLGLFVIILLSVPVMYYTSTYQTEFIKDTEFKFLVVGDFGELSPSWNYTKLPCKSVAESMLKLIKTEKISLLLSVGDNIYSDSTTEYFQKAEIIFSNIYRDILSYIPFYLSYGNHDYYNNRFRGNIIDQLNDNLFSPEVPSNKTIEMLGFKISFTFLPCDLICHGSFETNVVKNQCHKMGSNSSFEAEYTFLRRHLEEINKDKSITWKIVVIHYPIFSVATTGMDSENLKKYLLPILQEFKVDLILTGHNHNMQYFFYNYSSEYKYKKQTFNQKCMSEASINCGTYKLHCMKRSDKCSNKNKTCSNIWNVEESAKLNRLLKKSYIKGDGLHQVVQGAGGSDLDPICPKAVSPMAKNIFAYLDYGFSEISISRNHLNIKFIRANDSAVIFESNILSFV